MCQRPGRDASRQIARPKELLLFWKTVIAFFAMNSPFDHPGCAADHCCAAVPGRPWALKSNRFAVRRRPSRRTIRPTPKALHPKAQGQRSGAAAERHPGDESSERHIPRRGLTRRCGRSIPSITFVELQAVLVTQTPEFIVKRLSPVTPCLVGDIPFENVDMRGTEGESAVTIATSTVLRLSNAFGVRAGTSVRPPRVRCATLGFGM